MLSRVWRLASLIAVAIAASCMLQGCFSDDRAESTTTVSTTKPDSPTATTTTTTVSTLPPPKYASSPVTVFSYNLYWWCVAGEKNHPNPCNQCANNVCFDQLLKKMKDQGDVDLMGFQECKDVNKVLGGIGKSDAMTSSSAPPGGDGPDEAIAWRKTTWDQLGEPKHIEVDGDQYGPRFVSYIRLKLKGTDATLFFANHHGPLGHCVGTQGERLAQNIIDAVENNKEKTDNVILMGDFNCLPQDDSMKKLKDHFNHSAMDTTTHYDNIFTDKWIRVVSVDSVYGPPSDHSLLKATFQLADWKDQPYHPPPTKTTPAPSQDSTCKKLGCGNHNDDCWCQESCKTHESCCPDYDEVCAKADDLVLF